MSLKKDIARYQLRNDIHIF